MKCKILILLLCSSLLVHAQGEPSLVTIYDDGEFKKIPKDDVDKWLWRRYIKNQLKKHLTTGYKSSIVEKKDETFTLNSVTAGLGLRDIATRWFRSALRNIIPLIGSHRAIVYLCVKPLYYPITLLQFIKLHLQLARATK